MEQALQDKFKNVLSKLDDTFTSHDFIKKFLALYENEYRQWFEDSTMHTIHAKIGRLLADNQERLGIEKGGKICSETFHGTVDTVQSWRKTHSNAAVRHASFAILIILLLGAFLPASAQSFYDQKEWSHSDSIHATAFAEQTKGWEWLFIDSRTKKSVSYPVEAEYYVYDSHPQYKVKKYVGEIMLVFDENGKLVRVPYSPIYYKINYYGGTLYDNTSYDICELLDVRTVDEHYYVRQAKVNGDMVLDAYRSNQYGILSESKLLRRFVEEKVGHIYLPGFQLEKTILAVYKKYGLQLAYNNLLATEQAIKECETKESSQADRFIKQIEQDIEANYDEPLVERIDDLSFRVVFTNKKTGKKKCYIDRYSPAGAFRYSNTLEREK